MKLRITTLLVIILTLISYQNQAQQLQFKDLKSKPSKQPAFYQQFKDQLNKQNAGQSGRTESIEIVGGQPVDISEVPWQVALMAKEQGFQFCGGTIIDEYWILTAAHCLEGASPDQIQVLAGSSSVVDIEEGQLVDVVEIIMHPEYSDVGTGYDIALIRLASPLDLSGNSAQKVPYATPMDEQNGLTDEGVISLISGWGTLSEGGDSPDILYGAEVPIVSNETANSLDYQGLVTETMLAAGDIENGGIDACQGDSGGPLVVTNLAGTGYILAGITSWGFGCANPTSPGLYARVAFFANWIEENSGVINNEFPQLIISEIVQGDEAGNLPNYVEIFNASDDSYDLADVAIQLKAASGSIIQIELPNVDLASGETYLVSGSDFLADWGGTFTNVTPDLITDELDLDGNSSIQLIHATQLYTIDQYGSEKVAAQEWQYTGKVVARKSFVVYANSGLFFTQNFPEWGIVDYTAQNATPGNHEATLPENDASVISFSIQNNQEFVLCSESFDLSAKMTIKNTGSAAIEALDFTITYAEQQQTINKDFSAVPIGVGESRQIELPVLTYDTEGEYSFSVILNQINGFDDGNPTNNFREVSYKLLEGFKTTFNIFFDENAHENAFIILDSIQNNIVHFGNGGGFFDGYEQGETYSEEVCLQAGFYSFVFVDAVDISFGIDPGEGLLPPAEASFTINSSDHGDITVAEISGEFDDGLLFYGFKLPYENVTDAELKFISPLTDDLQYSCDLDLTIKLMVINTNSVPIDDFVISYGEVNQESTTYNYSGEPLLAGEGVELNLLIPLTTSGELSVFATITEVNGGMDDLTENNSETKALTFIIPEDPNALNFEFYIDSWPEEASWEILNEDGQIVTTGYFSEEDAENIVNVPICLPDGTYTVLIHDSFSDGGTGLIVYNENEDILFVITPAFFSKASFTFSLPYEIQLDAGFEIESPQLNEEILLCDDAVQLQVEWSFENKSNVPVHEFTFTYDAGIFSGDYQYVAGELNQFLILPGEKINIGLDLELAVGINEITSQITQLNDVALTVAAELHTFNIQIDPSLHPVRVSLTTDSWPEETSFKLINTSVEELIAEEYTNFQNTTINFEYCLVDGSYEFRLLDEWSDGGAAAALIHSTTGFSLGNIAGDSYQDVATRTFCLGCVNAPTNLRSSAITHQSVRLAWDDANNESGYIIYRSLDGIIWSQRQQLASNTITFTDINLQPATDYWYAVMAVNNLQNGISGFGNTVELRTNDPLGLSSNQSGTLYPNPLKVGDQLHVDMSKLPLNGIISIVDVLGREILISQTHSAGIQKIETQHWKPGVYFFRFESEAQSLSIPFILMD